MPIRSSAYFNNPQFAQAADNLMQLFAPPSGTEAAGWANANATKEKAARLDDFYSYMKSADYNQQMGDRMGVGAGVYAPTSSYQALNMDDATKRRGQDVVAGTSRANNAADNARAVETAQMSGLAGFYTPLNPGQIRPEVPSEIAARFGQPGAIGATAGAPKAPTEDEVKAAALAGLPQHIRESVAIGSTPVESIETPAGPKIAYRSDAVGQTPYEKSSPGRTITLADGTVIQDGGSGKAPTQAQGQLMNYTATARAMMPVLDELGGELTSPLEGASEASPSIGTLKPGNYMQSPKYQQARVAGERFVQSVLRNESGAATPDAEIAHYQETLLPRPGDDATQIKFKSWLRQVAVNAMAAGLGVNERRAEIDAAMAAGPPPGIKTGTAASPTGAPAAPAPAPSQQPAAPQGGYPDGTIIQNAAGRKMIRQNGTWAPYNG